MALDQVQWLKLSSGAVQKARPQPSEKPQQQDNPHFNRAKPGAEPHGGSFCYRTQRVFSFLSFSLSLAPFKRAFSTSTQLCSTLLCFSFHSMILPRSNQSDLSLSFDCRSPFSRRKDITHESNSLTRTCLCLCLRRKHHRFLCFHTCNFI